MDIGAGRYQAGYLVHGAIIQAQSPTDIADDCTGTESYYLPYDNGAYRCRPDNADGAVCGTVHHVEINRSFLYNGVCTNAWPDGNILRDFVRVYRDGCIPEPPAECGDGMCNGDEDCGTCPGEQ